MSDLDTCGECGWYAHTKFRNGKCDPALGEATSRLQSDAASIESTKLGYGDGRITFAIDDNFCVGFAVRHPWNLSDDARDMSRVVYYWDYLHALAHLDHEDALDLVKVLDEWHKRRTARKAGPL